MGGGGGAEETIDRSELNADRDGKKRQMRSRRMADAKESHT